MSSDLTEQNSFEKLLAEILPADFDLEKGVVFPDRSAARDLICRLEDEVKKMPEALTQIKTTHRFTDGLYVREVFIPKGLFVFGRIHKHANASFMCVGDKITVTEEGAIRLRAPFHAISKPGIKRFGFTLEDSVWTTVHPNPTNSQDIKQIEKELFTDSFDDVDSVYVTPVEVVTMEGAL